MTDGRLGFSASKSELHRTPADRKLIEQGRRAGLARSAVASTAGSAVPVKSVAVEQAFTLQLPDHAPKQARKSEQTYQDRRIAKLGLSPDGGLLLDAMVAEASRSSGWSVDFTTERAGEVLGIGRVRAAVAKDELLQRNLIRPQINNLGGPDGYRVMPFGPR